MNEWKQLFRHLKNMGVNSIFQEFNRCLVLDIATGDSTPKSSDTVDIVEDSIKQHRKELQHVDDSYPIDVSNIVDFVVPVIKNCESYKYYTINILSHKVIIEYFIVKGSVPQETTPAKTPMSVVLDNYDNEFSLHAAIIIFEDHECISDETLGKILKHELTHIVLEHMNFCTTVPLPEDNMDNEKSSDNLTRKEKELYEFREFLCDYIQYDTEANPNENPVEKFKDDAKKYLTWIAIDAYKPFIQAVEEYYKEENEKENNYE